jgi:uncharacterized protein YndB with AHSA1/START domain
MSTIAAALTTQVYSIFIRATPEQVWEAITTPAFTQKYFYGVPVAVSRETFDGCDSAQGAVVEFEPPHRLVHSWRALYDPETAAEPESRVTWEIAPQDGGVTLLTVVHDRLDESPKTAASVAGGWSYILSGLKSVLETGEGLSA